MAITVTDARDDVSLADATTGWSSGASVFTSAPTPKELTGCVGYQVSNTSVQAYYTQSSTNMATTLIYVWTFASGQMDTKANGGITMYIGDGTNNIGYEFAGSDVAVFRHNSGQPSWQCLVLDTASLPSTFTTYSGSEASLDFTAITRIGIGFKTLAKSVGGVENCYVDAIRSGTSGITVYGGISINYWDFTELADKDASNVAGTAYGVFRELGPNLFGVQGRITIGDSKGTAANFLDEIDTTFVFEDRGLDTSRYQFNVTGNTTGSQFVGFTRCTFTANAGVGVSISCTTALDALYWTDCSFVNIDVGMNLAVGNVTGCSFDGCARIDPGTSVFEDNNITNTAGTSGMKLDASGTSKWDNLTFTKGSSTAYGIEIQTAGTYDFSDIFFNDYGANGTSTAAVYNNSGGAVTINVQGGDTPTVTNGTSATTTVINSKTVVVFVKDADTNSPIIGARVYLTAAAGGDLTEGTVILNGLTTTGGLLSDSNFSYTNVQPVTGRVRYSSTPGSLYKTGILGSSIFPSGYNVTVLLVKDE